MVPVADLTVGEWIATSGDEVIARGASLEEVEERAREAGYEDGLFIVERVSGPGTFLL